MLLRETHNALDLCEFFFSFFSFFCQPYRSIGIFGAKIYFIDHRRAIAIQLFVPTKTQFFGSLLFQNKSQRRGIPQALLDKYRHLSIWTSLKWILSSGQKHVYTIKILLSEQIVFAAALYFRQVFVFCKLINESELEWCLLIMYK